MLLTQFPIARMVTKQCCVENCYSCSTREEDVGVTFHKFPKDEGLRELWVEVTRVTGGTDCGVYVCSRHFCKSDFQSYKDSKYILQSGISNIWMKFAHKICIKKH